MQLIRLSASGKVSFSIYNTKERILLTRSNNILPLATDIIARLLGNFAIGKVDTIKAYNTGTLLSTVPIIKTLHPDINQVEYTAIFNEASFNGNFDELDLCSSGMGSIAKLNGLSSSKDGVSSMSIVWTITIGQC